MTRDWEDLGSDGLCKNRRTKCADCVNYDTRFKECGTIVADITADGKFSDKYGWLPDEVKKKLRKERRK